MKRRGHKLKKRYGKSRGDKAYESPADKFYKLLSKEFVNVEYDPATQSGWARIGSAGRIDFRASGNDPAVIVELHPPRLKGPAATVKRAVDKINRVYSDTGS
jgi:hypothetical protein